MTKRKDLTYKHITHERKCSDNYIHTCTKHICTKHICTKHTHIDPSQTDGTFRAGGTAPKN